MLPDLAVDRAVAAAVESAAGGGHPVAIAVVDEAGVPVAFKRMRGATRVDAMRALGLAATAALLGRATEDLPDDSRQVDLGPFPLAAGPGGLVINERSGLIHGGIGVAASGDDAHAIASQAACAALDTYLIHSVLSDGDPRREPAEG
jgi:uncharacterized protein GlcG (DUF336 family)